MNFGFFLDEYGLYLEGLWTTVQLVALALAIALVLSVPLALIRNSRHKLLSMPAWAYIYFFRGTPMLVQLYLIYYGLAQTDFIRETPWLWAVFQHAWFCALLTFVLNSTAYTAEIVRGSINNTPSGEIEAARAYGMGPVKTFTRIIGPSSMRRALPAYSNEIIFMLHGSAIAGFVTLIDITGAARLIISRFYNPFEGYIIAALFYLVLTFSILYLLRRLENRWTKHLKDAI